LSYQLLKSTNFIKSAKKFAKKDTNFLIELNDVLNKLMVDPFAQSLKTHKLKGQLKEFWACSINYDLRLIFQFVKAFDNKTNQEVDAVLLSTIGTHDEVY